MEQEIWKQHSCRIATNKRRMLEVSNLGRRRVTSLITGKVLVQDFGSIAGDGYRGFGSFGRAHRQVAALFIPNPQNKPEVNHIDGDKANNHVSNLEWCTASENCRHARDIGLRIAPSGKNHSRYGQKHSEQAKSKMSLAKKGKPHPNRDFNTHVFYNYQTGITVKDLYINIRNNSQDLLGIGFGLVVKLKMGKTRSGKGWLYLGTI